MSLRLFWHFRYFWIFKWPQFCAIFFVIFVKLHVMHILEDFANDWMSPRESAKNRKMGIRGLICKIFVNYEVKFETCNKNIPRKKISCLSGHFEFSLSQRIRNKSSWKFAQVSRLFLRSKNFFSKFLLFKSHFLKIWKIIPIFFRYLSSA